MVNFSSSSTNNHLPKYQDVLPYDNSKNHGGGDNEDYDDKETSSTAVCTVDGPPMNPTNSELKEHHHHRNDSATNKFLSFQFFWKCYCVHVWFGLVTVVCRMMYEIITDPDYATSPPFSELRIGLLVCMVLNLVFVWLCIGCTYLLFTGTALSWSFGNIICFRYRERLIAAQLLAQQKEALLLHHLSNDTTSTTTPGVSSDDSLSNNRSQESIPQMDRASRFFMLLLAFNTTYNSIRASVHAIEAISQSFGLFNCVRLYVVLGFDVLAFWFLGISLYNVYVDKVATTITTPTNTTACSESCCENEASASMLVTKIDTSV